ncbi:hypothetical protein R3P38DRAFT_3221659 [Favolaschia claudopus]|uniref:Uncharacterized protein n=1 Tax=Favolaschia claudopus TaxID=2862362 RepID=A0AAV9ZZP4_9AGAR
MSSSTTTEDMSQDDSQQADAAERDSQHSLLLSSLRAHEYVIEAQEERTRLQRIQLARFRAGGAEFCERLITKEDELLSARNALHHYTRPRVAKYLRARLRRYRRLKYLYELDHPLFTHPEFPEHPLQTMWKNGVDHDGGWGRNAAPTETIPSAKLTEADDEPSPPHMPKPLPLVTEDMGSPPRLGWGLGWDEGGGW